MQTNTQTWPGGRMDQTSAAAYINRTPKTLANWRSRGMGPEFVKDPSGQIWYWQDSLDAWIRLGCESPNPPSQPEKNATLT